MVDEEGKRATELEETERLIADDVRNNSAWNHRFFLVNGRDEEARTEDSEAAVSATSSSAASMGVKHAPTLERELAFTHRAIARAPQNQSAWNYLRGTVERAGDTGLATLRTVCEEFASVDDEGKVRSSHALDLLAEIEAREGGDEGTRRAGRAYEMLATRFDPLRANYWNYLRGRLGVQEGVVA